MSLETKRLKIIPCTEETLYMTVEQGYDNGPHIENYVQKLKEDASLLYWGSWLVVRKSDGRMIGDIGFKGAPNRQKEVEIGYGFLEEYWNKGYATEAVGALVRWAFQTSKVETIRAETLHNNIGSIRVLEKLNMKQIGKTEKMIKWQLR
ncbi:MULTISPECIES: GNAT family N-acetyltransferase [unclassified Bacillus cereus group]|uniref:GNAT family N-acetyltransferase n=1 Tax=unclassified Bacillus cereus group TaxID=2750818 RepID=UPI001F5783F6|nr:MULTISPECIES: GNAT family N-acetyltransferase [unclassified Bacillus cereus group]